MQRIIGIDLGTTNSAAAFMSESGPQLIPNALGEVLTPSVVGVDQDGQIVTPRFPTKGEHQEGKMHR